MGKVYLYYTLYDVLDDVGYPFLPEPALYAYTENKDFAKQFEASRYMPAFIKVVKRKKEFPDYPKFMSENRDCQLITFPIPATEDDKTTIVGTYMEDSIIAEHCELMQCDIDDLYSTLHVLHKENFITDEAYQDLQVLLDYGVNEYNGAADFDIFHLFCSLFRRTLVPPKIWGGIDQIHYE